MASTTNTLIFSLKLLLICAGALSIASVLRFSVPFLIRFSISQAPSLWSSLLSWLRPPYLYVIINGIIISIVASSRFRQMKDEAEDFQIIAADNPRLTFQYQSPTVSEFDMVVECERKWTNPAVEVEEEKFVVAEYGGREAKVSDQEDKSVISQEEEEYAAVVPSRSIGYSPEIPFQESPATNHPLVHPRFANRKPVKSVPQGGWRSRSLRVAKPKQQHETLDDTWKMIMAGRESALTSENHGREIVLCEGRPPVKKSETFKDRTDYYNEVEAPQVTAARLRKEPSLGQEELNRRAEEFIKKFNEEMKLQRQESLDQYKHAHD